MNNLQKMNTAKKPLPSRRGRVINTTKRPFSPRGVRTRVSIAEACSKSANNIRKEVGNLKKSLNTVKPMPSPMTTVRLTSDQEEESNTQKGLTALEELFPKHVLDDIKERSETRKFEKENGSFYELMLQTVSVTDEDFEPAPEKMTSEQLEKLIMKTQTDMEEVEEKLQVKERERARLLRWWEVKHDILTYLFQCKSDREGEADTTYMENKSQSLC